jgi:hypothetical protein
VRHEPVELGEAAGVEEQVEPLPGRELPLLVLLRDTRGSPARLGGGAAMLQVVQEVAG